MLTLKILREQPEFVIERLAVKHFDAKEIVYKIIDIDKQRRSLQGELDSCLAEQKVKAGEIGKLMKEGKEAEAEAAKAVTAELKEKSKELEAKMETCQKEQDSLVVLLPNLPCAQVPEGRRIFSQMTVQENLEMGAYTNSSASPCSKYSSQNSTCKEFDNKRN